MIQGCGRPPLFSEVAALPSQASSDVNHSTTGNGNVHTQNKPSTSGDHATTGESGGNWNTALARSQMRRLRKGVRGSSNEPGAIRDTKILCASRFVKSCEESDFIARLVRHDIKPLFCHKYGKEESETVYFKFCVNSKDVDKCLNSKMWPRGVVIREWFNTTRRMQKSEATELSS